MKKVIFFLFCFYFSILTSCNIISSGDSTGTDGLDGTNVFLEDSSGNRYYSGATIFIGNVDFLNPTESTELKLKVLGNNTLTLKGSGEYIQFGEIEYFTYFDSTYGICYESNSTGSGPSANGDLLTSDYLSKNEISSTATVTQASPFSFSYSIKRLEYDVESSAKFECHKQYVIPALLDDKEYNFIFEVMCTFETSSPL